MVSRPAVAPWQVWWADLDPVVGREQAKVRPVVVVSSARHLTLTGGQLLTVLPVTSQNRGWPHHVPIVIGDKPSFAMTEQARTISVQRLRNITVPGLTQAEAARITTFLRAWIA